MSLYARFASLLWDVSGNLVAYDGRKLSWWVEGGRRGRERTRKFWSTGGGGVWSNCFTIN